MSSKNISEKLKSEVHAQTLEELLKGFEQVGEDPDHIEWVMKEGIWTPYYNTKKAPFPDLILMMLPNTTFPDLHCPYGVPIEYKRSRKEIKKAETQLDFGRLFIETTLMKPCPYGKFVSKNKKGFYTVKKFDYFTT